MKLVVSEYTAKYLGQLSVESLELYVRYSGLRHSLVVKKAVVPFKYLFIVKLQVLYFTSNNRIQYILSNISLSGNNVV